VLRAAPGAQLLIVDDASPDGTGAARRCLGRARRSHRGIAPRP